MARTAPNEEPTETELIVASLEPYEIRVMSYIALGKTHAFIASRLYIGEGSVKSYIERSMGKCGVDNKLALALFYIDHVLPLDTADPHYKEPGEKLAAWRKMAEDRRKQFAGIGELGQRQAEAAMLLADPANAALTDEELGAMLSPVVSATNYAEYVGRFSAALPVHTKSEGFNRRGVRWRLASILRLAPLETSKEETPE